jgi:hypothetical protein
MVRTRPLQRALQSSRLCDWIVFWVYCIAPFAKFKSTKCIYIIILYIYIHWHVIERSAEISEILERSTQRSHSSHISKQMIFLYGLELMPDTIKYSQVLKYSNVVLLRCVCSLGLFAAAQNKLESLPSLTSIFACPLEIFRSIYLLCINLRVCILKLCTGQESQRWTSWLWAGSDSSSRVVLQKPVIKIWCCLAALQTRTNSPNGQTRANTIRWTTPQAAIIFP